MPWLTPYGRRTSDGLTQWNVLKETLGYCNAEATLEQR